MNKFATPEQLADVSKASLEALLSQATTAFSRAERLAALNLNTSRTMLEDGAANTKAILAAKDPQELVKLQAELAKPMVDKAVAYARSVYEIATEGQNDLTKVFESQIADMNKAFSTALEQAEKSAPAGSEALFAAAKTSMAAASTAYDTMSKAAKQATEMAEANVAAATKAVRGK
ncbi:phasin family protein [Denitromonas iodatirespirans]|uniref:Phasin family protein n=1 Tax=Denitromonas iodatirespirans TaxID=2795389 RepID=A0A944D435_DENI1|nr:phasin family protein [Denitromonas iodatirespirans]MBT0959579.1 phasin family protein [Denitromonas iodatirespirans]